MSADHVAVARRMYEARNRGDVDAVIAECDPEVEWHPHLASLAGEPIRGHDGVREYLSSLQEDWEVFRHEPEEFIDCGETVVAYLNTIAQGKWSGIDVEVPVGHVISFRNGKVLRYVSYHERSEALEAAKRN
jgi:ketosteroid isomerase-like protein